LLLAQAGNFRVVDRAHAGADLHRTRVALPVVARLIPPKIGLIQ
jgi:hypothetical protein